MIVTAHLHQALLFYSKKVLVLYFIALIKSSLKCSWATEDAVEGLHLLWVIYDRRNHNNLADKSRPGMNGIIQRRIKLNSLQPKPWCEVHPCPAAQLPDRFSSVQVVYMSSMSNTSQLGVTEESLKKRCNEENLWKVIWSWSEYVFFFHY